LVRVYFATDVHGSDYVWRKWLSVPNFHKADVLILAGDLTGKAIVPIVKQPDGTYSCRIYGREWKLKDEKELKEMEDRISFTGYYPLACTTEDTAELAGDKQKLTNLFEEMIGNRITRWMDLLIEKVDVKKTMVIVMPGNDDDFLIDPIIKSYEDRGVIYPLGKVVNICYDLEMISIDYTNPTPWDTPRECSEEELEKKIRAEFAKVRDYSKTICNFHCPPFGTRLDLAPKLTKDLRPIHVLGKVVMVHVGSKAVQKVEKEYQPLLGLHGHIHESYASDHVGKTLVVNPGSEYTEGILRGFIIDLSEKGIERWWKVEG